MVFRRHEKQCYESSNRSRVSVEAIKPSKERTQLEICWKQWRGLWVKTLKSICIFFRITKLSRRSPQWGRKESTHICKVLQKKSSKSVEWAKRYDESLCPQTPNTRNDFAIHTDASSRRAKPDAGINRRARNPNPIAYFHRLSYKYQKPIGVEKRAEQRMTLGLSR